MDIKYIVIEGNISAGKTTIINRLKNQLSNTAIFVEEPIDEWYKFQENNTDILTLYYSDRKRYSFKMQLIAIMSQIKSLTEAFNEAREKGISYIIGERSFLNRYTFVEMIKEDNILSDLEFKILDEMLENLYRLYRPYRVIYLRTLPTECYSRIIDRNISNLITALKSDINVLDRSSKIDRALARIKAESFISEEYIERLHNHYESFLTSEIILSKISPPIVAHTYEDIYHIVNNI